MVLISVAMRCLRLLWLVFSATACGPAAKDYAGRWDYSEKRTMTCAADGGSAETELEPARTADEEARDGQLWDVGPGGDLLEHLAGADGNPPQVIHYEVNGFTATEIGAEIRLAKVFPKAKVLKASSVVTLSKDRKNMVRVIEMQFTAPMLPTCTIMQTGTYRRR